MSTPFLHLIFFALLKDFSLEVALPVCTQEPASDLLVSVIIPAKNEADHIWQTLLALYHQVTPHGLALPRSVYEIIVLANNCQDHTAATVCSFGKKHPDLRLHVAEISLPPTCAHVGYARRLLMDEAYQRLMHTGKPQGIIASTDGDTVVQATWLYHILQAISQGADAVGGRILTHPEKINPERKYYLQDVTYRYLYTQLETLLNPDPADPWPRHFQHFGPSLAVTCAAYDRVGRLPVLASLEDVAFFEALQRHDCKIRHSPDVRVYTSARKNGRVDFGFSVQLQQWAAQHAAAQPLMVPGLEACQYLIRLRKRLRSCWLHFSQNLDEMYRLADELGVAGHTLIDQITAAPYFGTLYQLLMHTPSVKEVLAQRFDPVPIDQAIQQLRACVKTATAAFQRDPGGMHTPAPPVAQPFRADALGV